MPAERFKPKIEASEVSCLAGETKRKFMLRDFAWQAEIEECLAIIRSTK